MKYNEQSMHIKKKILLLIVACITFSCDDISVNDGSSAIDVSSLVRPSSYKLVWNDEFDGNDSAPNPTKWNYDLGAKLINGSVWGNNEREFYTSDRVNSYIEDGNLVIQARHAPRDANIVATSARMKSDTPDYFEAIGSEPYGYYEIRARLHCIKGSWPAIWLLGKDGDWPARGEIDILEWSQFNTQENATSAIHTEERSGGNSRYKSQTLPDMCSAYHNYQLHWTKDKLVIGIDGKETLSFDRESSYTNREWPFDKPAFLIMNVAVGGTLGGDVNNTRINDMKLEIDYVRVWKN